MVWIVKTQEHIEIFQVSDFHLNIENFIEWRDHLNCQHLSALRLKKLLKLLLQARTGPILWRQASYMQSLSLQKVILRLDQLERLFC